MKTKHRVTYISADGAVCTDEIQVDNLTQLHNAYEGIHVLEIEQVTETTRAALLDEIEASAVAGRLAVADVAGIDALNYEALALGIDQNALDAQLEADRQDEIGFARYGF